MDEHVAAALEDAFPGREVEAAAPTGPSWNDANRTVRVEFADGEAVYLKVALDGSGERIARERAAIARVDATGSVPVPTVLAVETDAAVPHLATAPVAGRSLLGAWSEADEAGRAALARRIGAALAALHADRFDVHGRVVGGAEGPEIEPAAWTDVLVDTIEDARARATSERFDRHFEAVIAAVEEHRERLDEAPAALLHGDPAHPNCFLASGGSTGEGGERIGLLDWELAHVGDPARDLYRARDQGFGSLEDDGPERLAAALREGYRDRAGALPDGYESRRPIYEAVRFLGRSGFVDKYADYRGESEEKLALRIEEGMERRLDAIR